MPGWIEPLVPTRMIVRMPTWNSSLTTMLIDGAPMPLVAHTTGAPPGSVPRKLSRPRLRASTRLSRRWRWRSARCGPGSPDSRAIVGPLGEVVEAETDVVEAPSGAAAYHGARSVPEPAASR